MDVRLTSLLVIAIALLGLITLHAAESAPADRAGAKRTIVIFGDSLTAGYGLVNPVEDSFPSRLQRKIDAANLSYRIINAGLSGETSAAGARRIDWILRQPTDVFVLALGANDGLRGIDPAVTRANLESILTRVRAKYPKARLVVAGMIMPATLGADYAKSFGEVFPAVAAHFEAHLLPFLLEGVAGVPELNQHDGIHPTSEGHAILAETVWKTLRPLL